MQIRETTKKLTTDKSIKPCDNSEKEILKNKRKKSFNEKEQSLVTIQIQLSFYNHIQSLYEENDLESSKKYGNTLRIHHYC